MLTYKDHSLIFSLNPKIGQLWYDTTNKKLREWSGKEWAIVEDADSIC